MPSCKAISLSRFLSTLSLRRATVYLQVFWDCSRYFYPRSPCGERLTALWLIFPIKSFLSTLSLRRATSNYRDGLSTWGISIHALLAESDAQKRKIKQGITHFYPRSPCGERHGCVVGIDVGLKISIHALLAESDRTHLARIAAADNFYPRSPCGERHCRQVKISRFTVISIHALLAESDISRYTARPLSSYFYPRSPCGERPFSSSYGSAPALFLSTLSLRRATHASM